MAIEKITVVDQVSVDENGIVHVRSATRLIENGVVLSQTYHRATLVPGQDVSGQSDRVKAICSATWTPEIVDTYKASLIPIFST